MTERAETDVGVKGTVVLVDGTEVEFNIHADGTFTQWGAPTEKLGETVALMERLAEAFLVEYVDGRTCSECGVIVTPDIRGCSCGMADYGAPGHDGDEDGDLLCEDCGSGVVSRVTHAEEELLSHLDLEHGIDPNTLEGGLPELRSIHEREHLAAGDPLCENQR